MKQQHKPGCMANMNCLVIHLDGVCPGPYGKCNCNFSESEGEKWEALDKDQTERMRGYRDSSREPGLKVNEVPLPGKWELNYSLTVYDVADKQNQIIDYLAAHYGK